MEKELIWNFRESSHGNFKFFAKGGQHIVVEDPYFEQLAAECETPEIRQVARFNFQEYIYRYRTLPKEEHSSATQGFADVQNFRFERLYEIFEGQLPRQHTVAKVVYFNREHLEYIWSHRGGIPDGMYKNLLDGAGWAVITKQDRLRDLTSGDLAFRVPYAEWNGSDAEFYAQVSHRWFIDPIDPPTEQEIRQFHAVQPSEELLELLLDCEINQARKSQVKNVINKAIKHALLTNEPIDISGKDNIFIGKEGDLWAPDILFPMPEPILELLPTTVLKVQNKIGLTVKELNYLLNGMGYVRSMNYLAALFDCPDRIRLFDGHTIKLETWQNIHSLLTNLSTYKQLAESTEMY